MTRAKAFGYAGILVAALSVAPVALAQDIAGRSAAVTGSGGDAADLAKKLSNPIADLISVPVTGAKPRAVECGAGVDGATD